MNLIHIEYTNKKSIFISILFLLLGIILATNPEGVVGVISYLLGGIIIIIGIVNLLNYYKIKKTLNVENNLILYFGVFLIVIGIVTFFLASLVETIIRLILGAIIIYNGIMRLIEVLKTKKTFIPFIITLIISILMIIGGLYILISVNLVYRGLGIIIAIYAVLDIAGYITSNQKQ